jgi:hypothetical protein
MPPVMQSTELNGRLKCADYAIIRTTKETETPHNFAGAIYTALLAEDPDSKPMIGRLKLEIGQTVWVDAPTVVSAGFVFLIIKPTKSLSLDHGVTFERMARLEAENARLQQQIALSREIMETSKINYICPSRDCYEGFNDMKALKNHWKKREMKNGYEDPHVRFLERSKDHPAFFAAYQSGLESDLPVTRVPPDHTCFRRDFIISESRRDPPSLENLPSSMSECLNFLFFFFFLLLNETAMRHLVPHHQHTSINIFILSTGIVYISWSPIRN